VKITASEVDHTPVKPAFGYRIDHAGRSVVLSGDTRLVHEVAVFSERRTWDHWRPAKT
jgi:ribonuclease BN (tRNA processing enzyme)